MIWLILQLAVLREACADRSLADLLILHPTAPSAQVAGLERKFIPNGQHKIEIWVARSPAAKRWNRVDAFVLEFTGNGNSAESITRWVADGVWRNQAVEVWSLNYPGYGNSTGAAKLRSIGPAARAAFDALREVAGDRPIFVSGASLGGMTAIHVAANRRVAGVLVLNPPALREVVTAGHGWWNLWLLSSFVAVQIPDELDTIANAARCAAPIFAVVSENDEVVPASVQQRIFERYGGPKLIVQMRGATHGSNMDNAAIAARENWLDARWRELFKF